MSQMTTVEDFQKSLVVEKSSRSHILMLMGFFGYSGGGKTVTALVSALGLVWPKTKVGIIDTEQRRSGIAADVVKALALARYKQEPEIRHIYLEPPFHPLKYVAAVRKLQEDGCAAIVVDSMTHSWNGEGGYLDLKEEALDRMAGDDWKKREACAMAAAARTKPQTHAKLVDALLHAKVPIILCFRGKEKTTMQKNDQNKNVPTKDEFATPIHEAGLIYEMLIAGECGANEEGIGGFCRFTGPGCKHTHPDFLAMLPKPNEQFGFHHAEAIAAWCASAGTPKTASQPNGQPTAKSLLKELYQLTQPIHKWTQGMSAKDWEFSKGLVDAWLVEKAIIKDTEEVATFDATRLADVISKAKEAL